MNRFICNDISSIAAYTPGEQPKDRKYIKLNTNESPFPPPKATVKAVKNQAKTLNLYSDPTVGDLTRELAKFHSVSGNNVIVTNGSDEVLAFIMYAFARGKKVMFPDVTYGFYSSLCALYNVEYQEKPLNDDFTVNLDDYKKADVVFLANPNAQTGISIGFGNLLEFIRSDKNRLVIVDEAYVDFGGKTVAPLIKDCDNLIVTRTFSKSRSLAGGRLGYALACADIISILSTVKYNFNPYSVNSMSLAAGVTAMQHNIYFNECVEKIVETRARFVSGAEKLGIECLPSSANFVMAKLPQLGGADLKAKLMDMGILVRHFNNERIKDFVRITIGSNKEMNVLLDALKVIIGELNENSGD